MGSEMCIRDSSDIMGILIDVISESPRHIEFVNVSNVPFFVESRLYLPHQSLVFSLHPTMNRVAVSTNSEYVAIYTDSIHYETEIPSSIDTDQDNIPDEIDDDTFLLNVNLLSLTKNIGLHILPPSVRIIISRSTLSKDIEVKINFM